MIEKIIEGVKTIKDLFKEEEVSSIEKLQLKKMKKALTFYIQIENQIEKHFNLSENFLEDCTEIQFKNLYKEILYKELKSDKALKESLAEIANRYEREKDYEDLRNQNFLLTIENQNLLNQLEEERRFTFFLKFIEKTKNENDGKITMDDIIKYNSLVKEKKIVPSLFPYDENVELDDSVPQNFSDGEDFENIFKEEEIDLNKIPELDLNKICGTGRRASKEREIRKLIHILINGIDSCKYKKKNGKWNYKKIGEKLNINQIIVAKYLKK